MTMVLATLSNMAKNIVIRKTSVKKMCHPAQKYILFQNPGLLKSSQVREKGNTARQADRSKQLITINRRVGTFLLLIR